MEFPQPKNTYEQLEKGEDAAIKIKIEGKEISDIDQIDFKGILEEEGCCIVKFYYGNKELELIIEEVAGSRGMRYFAHSGIENIQGEEKSVKNQTTLLYEKVKLAIEKAANQTGKPISYGFSLYFTLPDGKPNPMRRWASSPKKGQAIFQWDSIRIDQSNRCAYFRKNFLPEDQSK